MTTCSTHAAALNPSAPIIQTATRYRGAAELCAAIRAAAELAPEIAPELEYPDRYAAGRYTHTEPAEIEPGALLAFMLARQWVEIVTDGPACKYPRVNVHPETPGPFLPIRADRRAVFAYAAPDGARGSLTVANVRPALLALADKVHANRGAFDGKVKRAAKPAKPASSAPHVAARAFWEARQYAEALQLAENVGALYFGHSGEAGAHPYMAAETVDAAGFAFIIARSIRSGRFRVLGASCGLAADVVRGGAPTDSGFATHSAARDWLETSAECEAWRAKMAAAIARAAPIDQAAARAHYLAEIDGAADAPETARDAPIAPAETIGTPEPVDAPAAAAIEPAADVVDVEQLTRQLMRAAGVKPVNPGPDAPAPGVAAPEPGAVVDARAVFDAATCAAAIELERITCSLPSDSERRRVIDAGRRGAIGARGAVVAMLERFAPRTVPADRYATDTHERPCAAPGLTSYRARGAFGWIMIGARDPADAMREALRSHPQPHSLQEWSGTEYVPCAPPAGEFETAPDLAAQILAAIGACEPGSILTARGIAHAIDNGAPIDAADLARECEALAAAGKLTRFDYSAQAFPPGFALPYVAPVDPVPVNLEPMPRGMESRGRDTCAFKALRVGMAFQFDADGPVWVRARGGYRPGCGGQLHACAPHTPVIKGAPATVDVETLRAQLRRVETAILLGAPSRFSNAGGGDIEAACAHPSTPARLKAERAALRDRIRAAAPLPVEPAPVPVEPAPESGPSLADLRSANETASTIASTIEECSADPATRARMLAREAERVRGVASGGACLPAIARRFALAASMLDGLAEVRRAAAVAPVPGEPEPAPAPLPGESDDDETTPAPLDGLDVAELGPEALEAFDLPQPTAPAYREAPAPAVPLRIPPTDLRSLIPRRNTP